MSELRWILALLGVLFVVGVFLWERRKQRPRVLATRSTANGAGAAAGPAPSGGDEATGWKAESAREAPLVLPDIRAREPIQPLPVIEVPADDARFGADEPAPAAGRAAPRIEPTWDDSAELMPASEPGPTLEPSFESSPAPPPEPAPATTLAVRAGNGSAAGEGSPRNGLAPGIPVLSPARIDPLPRPDASSLRLEWADELERRIVAIRVVPIVERFGGRAVRQALAGEGFLHGPLGIFHRALADGRVVLSCASLTKPGSFDPATMDSQRYAGLNLFGVLPGPLSPAATLEDLVTVSRTLAARLGGLLQDERGQALDAARIASLREQLAAPGMSPSRPPGESGGAGESASP